ncbi:MAG TPA: hypothetical protein VK250_05445 [Nitrososphaeraceae archaeon]|nr:hypothetical protein [Nitrososphaeraceae archaeon]
MHQNIYKEKDEIVSRDIRRSVSNNHGIELNTVVREICKSTAHAKSLVENSIMKSEPEINYNNVIYGYIFVKRNSIYVT